MTETIMETSTRVWTPLDYDADGKQVDCLRVPYSTDLSAYGWIPIPIICIRNGEGPTALLVAGNHGDEYEGQVALLELVRSLEPGDVRGRIIIMPALNYPAVEAGRRVSPLDGGNLNRLMPGNPVGSPTSMIAHYVCNVLLPMADLLVDLHSGGRSLQYVTSTLARPGRDAAEQASLLEAMRIFGAPVGCLSDGAGGGGMTTLAAAAQERGVLAVTTELGGGATLDPVALQLARSGLQRLLKHYNITPDFECEPPFATRLMRVGGRNGFVYASCRGIFEPVAALAQDVVSGQLAGRIHDFDHPLREPETVRFAMSGLVVCRRVPSLVRPGDCLFKVVVDHAAEKMS